MLTKVAFDVTPMLGLQTGVGVVTKHLFDALVQRRDLDLSAFAMTVRGYGELTSQLPASMRRNRVPMPAGLLQKVWRFASWPPVDLWTGEVGVVHGTNFVVPPTSGAALVTVHDMTALRYPEMCEPHTLEYPKLIRNAVARGAHVHTFSQFVAAEVQEMLNVPAERVHVIPAALEYYHSPGAPHADTSPYVLAIGTVEPRKNYPALVRAFDAIASKHPDTKLIIAGSRGWGFDKLQSAIETAKHPKQIQYVGRVSDDERDKLLQKAALLVYPSVYEGFGFPPLEAMRAGVPVVASNAGALPEVLGDAALLVDPNDEAALASAIESVFTDKDLHARLVRDGATREQMYDWKKTADRFASLYKELAT
jgi:glycosyltransferase involved in cell wall biosynthesis